MLLTLALAALSACASNSGALDNNVGNGSDDVVKACEAKGQWTRATHSECISCASVVIAAACTCDDLAGRCYAQGRAQAADADCSEEVSACIRDCGSDCACTDRCYAGHASCRGKASALSGCVVVACDSSCR